jgi:hypothetical protein
MPYPKDTFSSGQTPKYNDQYGDKPFVRDAERNKGAKNLIKNSLPKGEEMKGGY